MQNHNINNNPYRTLEQIHQGIEDYFDCRLSDHQEGQLRQALASTEYNTPEIEECIAVMGFKTVPNRKELQLTSSLKNMRIIHKKSPMRWISAVAASILVSILIAVPLLTGDPDNLVQSDCFAYVGGDKITDEDVVMRMLMEDLDEFDQSLNQINDDFDSTMEYLSQIIEENENPL